MPPLHHLILIALLSSLSMTLTSASALAQDSDPEAASEAARGVPVTLAQARAKAIGANLPLLIARLDARLGAVSARQARRPFVPVIQLEAGWRDDVALIVDERNRSLTYSATLNWVLPVGTRLFASAGATDFFSGASFVPVPATALQLGVVQPLLRDGWGEGNLLAQRDLDVALQRAIFLSVLNEFLAELDIAYWELAFSQANLNIRVRSRDRARQQFDDTSENIRRGLLAPGEIHIVEENLVFFEQQLVRAQEVVELTQVRLARLLRDHSPTPMLAADALDAPTLATPELEAMYETALQLNPSLKAQEVLIAQAREQVSFDRNQIKPALDASAALRLNGVDPIRSQAWQQAISADQPDWRVGLVFEVPLVRDPDHARVERAEIGLQQQQLTRDDARDRVRFGLRELAIQLTRRQQLLELSQRGVRLAELKLQTEQEKYQSGLSTLPNVVLFQRDLDTARNAYERAITDVLIARTRVAQQIGDLHQRAGVKVN